ncbi:MAG: chromosome partitioning protein ParA [Bacteroidetes bacterium]|nr:chromosome partitioning protein ParA [Bacteroidota bacterium]
MGLFDFLKKKELAEINKLKLQLERYKSIIDIEAEAKKQKENLENFIALKATETKGVQEEYNKLSTNYQSALETYTRLRKEISLFENKLDLIEFGVYEPIYDFDKSDDYRDEQNKIIELQKEMISSEKAAVCKANWTIDGSEAKGRASTKRYIKLTLRAFNGECESLTAKVKWNNVNQMKERIRKSFETINKIGESQTVTIQPAYLDLKIKELVLEHEFQLKRQKEKEELRAAQESLREEEKARREFEQAQKEAEKEELNYQKALDKARKEINLTTGAKHDLLRAQIEKLEQELKEAHERKERALSMAQQTKRGHVYSISNIGSFGEQVYKIGMTRRLEPEEELKN